MAITTPILRDASINLVQRNWKRQAREMGAGLANIQMEAKSDKARSSPKLWGAAATIIKVIVVFSNSLHVDCVGRSGGLILLWNDVWDVHITSFSRFHIDAVVVDNNANTWRFTGFYGHPHRAHRQSSWDLLHALMNIPWCSCVWMKNRVVSFCS
ncbi:hypothetical protein PanWU01x14_307060 [Parasponia andersonii]|uniref:Endonuclease/exonuclease/phosphatase n=1 Tax=Parasponia andersonii TaxID=3476 RepID=A0A2P5ARN4_PARAD|nr:hypothetical protein PanWU01x14_307060 [Parasponia andersonii]